MAVIEIGNQGRRPQTREVGDVSHKANGLRHKKSRSISVAIR